MTIVGHIQQDISLLTILAKRWDLDHNTFHLTLGEMIVTLRYLQDMGNPH